MRVSHTVSEHTEDTRVKTATEPNGRVLNRNLLCAEATGKNPCRKSEFDIRVPAELQIRYGCQLVLSDNIYALTAALASNKSVATAGVSNNSFAEISEMSASYRPR